MDGTPVAERTRRGGRAARHALRSRPLDEELRPVQPGLAGGAYRPLDEAGVAAIDVQHTVEVVDLHQRDDFAADLLRTCEAADARARGSWNEALPADLLRELGDLLPDGSDDTIWAAAQAAAFEAISGAGT